MHICFVTIDYHSASKGGGIGSYISTLGEELVKRGHRVSVVCRLESGEASSVEQNGIREWRVPFGDFHYYVSKIPLLRRVLTLPLRELEWSYALWRQVRLLHNSDPIDIVESCETGNLLSVLFPHSMPWAIRAHGSTFSFKKFSGEQIGLSEKIDRWLQRYCMLRACALSAPSRFQASQIEEELGKRKQVVVIPNPVDESFFAHKPSVEIKQCVDGKRKRILYTGRIALCKGTLVLLQAMRLIVDRRSDVELVIAGGRHVSISQTVLDGLLSTESMQRQVTLLGHVPWQSLKDYYDDCDVFVVPSYYETFCISAAEAMAAAKPVVGTTGTALSEVVEDGVSGLLVPPGDVTALTAAVLLLLGDSDLARRMGEAGHAKALREYNVSVLTRTTLDFYNRTLSGGTTG